MTHLSGVALHSEGSLVHVGDGKVEPAQGLHQRQTFLDHQVRALASEHRVLLPTTEEKQATTQESNEQNKKVRRQFHQQQHTTTTRKTTMHEHKLILRRITNTP